MYIVWLLLSLCNVISASDDSSIDSYEANILLLKNNNRELSKINDILHSENLLLKSYLAIFMEKNDVFANENKNLKILTEFNFNQIKNLEAENDRLRQILEENNKKKTVKKVVYSHDDNQLGSKFSCRKKEGCSQEKINDFFTKIHEKRMHEKK
ncbi:MAG: hypothetical protein ACXWL5_04155 [Candidatus Chromulinivorax sp.]